MNVLDIKDPKFLKKLSIDELNVLANDIRSFVIDSVSKTGGHLSSNLGVVELTIALHWAFNAPKDKILFDVGHQCYTHKILTGRAKDMATMRQFGGISGFQKRVESKYDCFEAGHSSTCLSTALGMAAARDLNNEKYEVVPVVGDGSIVSGLSLEALNQIGYQKRKLIIVFNDNNMSISKNVGALNKTMNKLRNSRSYNSLKDSVKSILKKGKNGENIIKVIHDVKEKVKEGVVDTSFFSDFGIYYIGPVDGHNISALIRAFEVAKSKDVPVVVHCITKKGYGYKYAQNDVDGCWHGVGKFDVKTGEILSKTPVNEISYSKLVADCVNRQMSKDKDIVAITPAMITGSCLKEIFNNYKNRSFDVGIAEDMAIDFACGMSLSGKKPFVSIYSSFLQRSYDQLNHDVSRMNLPMVVGIDRCSLVGEDGETHHGVFDISFLRSLPNVVIAQGKDANEINNLIETGFKSKKPFFIRYPRGSVINDLDLKNTKKLEIGKWEYLVNVKSPNAYIISYGNDLMTMKKIIDDNKMNISLINARFIKPIDEEMLSKINTNKPIYVYTNDIIKGGLGDEILEYFNNNNKTVVLKIIGIDDKFVTHGSLLQLKQSLNIDIKSLFDEINRAK